MARRWLIVADDLTGAADCAIAFAKHGLHTAVRWGGEPADTNEIVLSYDADSRNLGPAGAGARHAAALSGLYRPELSFFKKIDSTLRGQPAAELAATLDLVRERAGRAFGILAPAFPATGRTTENGRICVQGRPLEDTETWRRDHSYPTAFLPEVLASSGIGAEVIGLDLVRSGEAGLRAALLATAANGAAVAICDATSEDDLARIAAASFGRGAAGLPPGLFWIGSAGLAHALAEASPKLPSQPPALSKRNGGVLTVVGSLAAASRAAARRLAAEPGLRHIPVEPEILLSGLHREECSRYFDAVVAGLEAGQDVLVEVRMDGEPNMELGPQIADRLGALLAPAARHMGGFAATGGETAAALLGHLGVDGLRLVDEIEPGVSLGLTLGRINVPIVTKAGAFGDEGTLARVVHRLRAIIQQGFVA